MARAYVALGSNLQEPARQLDAALEALAALPQTRVLGHSCWYLNAAVGVEEEQPDFANGAAVLETALAPQSLLAAMQGIETARGRRRGRKNEARVLDLDLLLYEGRTCRENGLTLPHPRMLGRDFVLRPLAELAPDLVLPGGQSAAKACAALKERKMTRLPKTRTRP